MDGQEMEFTLRKLVRVLLVLLALAILGMMVVLWQTPIGGAWRQIFVFLFGSRAPQFFYLTIGFVVVVVLAVAFLSSRRKASPVAAQAQINSFERPGAFDRPNGFAKMTPMQKGNTGTDTEPPLVLEPLYTRKPREEGAGTTQ